MNKILRLIILVSLIYMSNSFACELNGQSNGRIAIRMDSGKARFYHIGTGERFTPRGFNYIQLVQAPDGPYGESELFHPDIHNPISIDDDFQRMAALGYNVVRVFIDLCAEPRCISNVNGLDENYIANIAGLLERARQGYNDRPLITDAVEAWKYGPVIKKVYDEVREYGKDQITSYIDLDANGEVTIGEYQTVHPKVNLFLDVIWDHYKSYDGFELSDLTHKPDSPWDRAVKKFGINHIIPNDFIKEYYSELIQQNGGSP